jgi:hypothetical protein
LDHTCTIWQWSADHDAIFSSNYFLACQAWATAGTMVECLEASYEETLSAQRSSFALTITMIGRFLYDFLALFTTVVTWVFVLTGKSPGSCSSDSFSPA